MPKILIKNGKVWDGERFYFADILTENEKIAKIADKICETAEFEYDASGKVLSNAYIYPCFIDGETTTDDFSSEAVDLTADAKYKAFVWGGVSLMEPFCVQLPIN